MTWGWYRASCDLDNELVKPSHPVFENLALVEPEARVVMVRSEVRNADCRLLLGTIAEESDMPLLKSCHAVLVVFAVI